MPFNINGFKHYGLVHGGARPSLFTVQLNLPPNIGLDPQSATKFRFLCRSAALPESTVASIDVPYFGRKIKIAGDRTFQDWSVNVMNDEDFNLRGMFEAWSNALNRMVANVRDPGISSEQYKVDLEVFQFGKDGEIIRSYILNGAFPTQIGAIALDWDSANQIESFSVNFAYDFWTPGIEISKKSSGTNIYGVDVSSDGPNGPA